MTNITPFLSLCHDPQTNSPLMIDEALAFAERGWPIIPLYEPLSNGSCSCLDPSCDSIGKHPRIRHGIKEASCDPSQIKKWWGQWPKANIAVATGKPTGIVVIDIDHNRGGAENLQKLQAEYGPLPETLNATTGNGLHIYFSSPISFRNAVDVRPGIDIRGGQGYIVAPPSLHFSGRRYFWNKPQELTAASTWLEKIVQKKPAPNINRTEQHSFPEGTRNSSLTSIAGALRAKVFQNHKFYKY